MAMQRSFIEHSTHFLRFVLILILVPLVVAAQATPDAADDSFPLVNDAPQTVNVLANDTPGVTISYVDPATDHGNAITLNGGGSLLIDPAPGFEGTATFTYSVTDGSQSDDALVTITYSNPEPPPPPPNVPPTASAGPDQTVEDTDNSGSESVTLDGSLSSDSDGTIVSYSWSENGTEIATGVSPAVDLAIGTHVITLTVTDDRGSTATASAIVTITYEAPPPPVLFAVDDFYTTTNDYGRYQPAPGVLENDSPGASVIPFDGQTSAGNYVSVASDGSFQLSAPWGYAGPATFDYTIADDQGNQDSATVTITYEWPNDPVVALDDVFYLPNNTSTGLGVPGLLGNDTPGAWVANSDIDLLFDGSGVVNADGSVHFPHPGGFVGTVTFTYIVNHPNGSQDDATVTINYYDPLAAVAADDYYVLRNNQSHDLLAPGVLGNDSSGAWVIDDTLDTLFDGSGYVNSDGSLYVPSAEGFVGDVTFTYIIENAVPSQDIATVTLHFEAAPLIATSPDYFTVMAGTPLNYANVLDNDVGDGLYVSNWWADPSTTSLYVESDGVINFTPDADFAGTIVVTYEVSDLPGNTVMEMATVTVEPAPIGCAYQTDIPQGECDALVNLYNSTNGWAWTSNTGWLANNSPCSWFGVYCDNGHVTSIGLGQNQLNGTLPTLVPFSSLTYLNLSYNQLTGEIPELPGSLQFVQLQSNQLTGNIPGLPAGLQELDLGGNRLQGSIPALYAPLQSLRLPVNQLTGTIPELPGSLLYLEVSNNLLEGNIPELPDGLIQLHAAFNQLEGSLPALPASLESVILVRNQLSGNIPELPDGLQVLGLGANRLEGTIPALPSALVDMSLRDNQLTGTIPELPPGLYFLWLHNNQLSGEIPASITGTAITVGDSLRLCGGANTVHSTNAAVNAFINALQPGWSPNNSCVANVPPTASAGPDQTVTDTDNSGAESVTLDGSLSSDSDGTIASYSWSENGTEIATGVNPTVDLAVGVHNIILTVADNRGGTATDTVTVEVRMPIGCAYQTQIPQDECDALVNLYNSTNGPGWINKTGWLATNTPCSWYGVWCDGGHVKGLYLPWNQLLGTLPEIPAQLENLHLDGNQLSGSLPVLPNSLKLLQVGVNQFSGPIPALPESLVEIRLDRNRFEGILPEDLPDNLTLLYAWSNQLTGPLPALPPGLQYLIAFDNHLSGPLPDLPPSLRQIDVTSNQLSGPIPVSIASNFSLFEIKICGGANDLYSDDPAVNSFLEPRVPGWAANGNRCIPLPPNVPPTADAGPDQTVTDADNSGAESVTLDGSLSGDSDGTIASYLWSENGTEIATGVSPVVNLAVGVHNITLTVTDNRGGTATDTVTVTVVLPPNVPPTANAGPDQTVTDTDNSGAESVTLDGSLSGDSDGTIISYSWSENGTEFATGVSPIVNLAVGVHNITLTVTDNRGGIATDTVTVTVVLPPNVPPIADAGPDQTVIDIDFGGAESFGLDGSLSSDSDGWIVSYSWSENGTVIATGVNPTVTLNDGTHDLTLTVTDNRGATATDTVTVTVIVNLPPTANAGPDQTVTDTGNDGSEDVMLDGSLSSDRDGTIVSYSWSENGAEIATGVNPTVTLNDGTHDLTLTVTDNRGATATDTVTVIVNLLPTADAGPDQTVTDTGNDGSEDVMLDGSLSSDRDGTIVSYSWSENGAEIVTIAKPTVRLAVGVHHITLTVTDNRGGTATDTVTVTVVLPPNVPPTANAGPDQTVTDADNSGAESVTLDGSQSSDSDGTIASYSWSENGTEIATGVNPTVRLAVGVHHITLTVTDNRGATATDTVTVTVVLPPNVPPMVHAGEDQTVIDANNDGSESVRLMGEAGDSDGIVLHYRWVDNGILIATDPNPLVTLDVGIHVITLTVADDRGATATDSVTVTVNAPAITNQPPQLNIYFSEVSTIRRIALNLGDYRDPDGGQVTLTSSVGSIVKSGNSQGVWMWSYLVPGSTPRGTIITVTMTATDAHGAVATQTFTVRVR
ncbi:MAG: tandem-95 repeat protein [Anaerolineae bacterium]|nr:tandem-95 repeat protein [Anaerolineae bacterium]